MENAIEIYKTKDNHTEVEVKIDNETVWLTQKQMAQLFDKDSDTISLHLKNIYTEGELEENSTTELSSVVQKEGKREVNRKIKYYNLDVIISVGYRVKSKRGTQFRQWATQRLRDYLVKGYAINQKRLNELQQVVQLIQQSGGQQLKSTEAKGLLDILTNYTRSFVLLNQYDSGKLQTKGFTSHISYVIEYPEATAAIAGLKKQLLAKKEASQLLARKKTTVLKAFYSA